MISFWLSVSMASSRRCINSCLESPGGIGGNVLTTISPGVFAIVSFGQKHPEFNATGTTSSPVAVPAVEPYLQLI